MCLNGPGRVRAKTFTCVVIRDPRYSYFGILDPKQNWALESDSPLYWPRKRGGICLLGP